MNKGVFAPGCSRTDHGAQRAMKATVVSVAIFLLALVPLLNVLCGLHAMHAGEADTVVAGAFGAHGDQPGDDNESSCAEVVELVDSGRVFSPLAGISLQPVSVISAPAAAGPVRVFGARRAFPTATSPPFEPVFRRFPRLLI